MYKLLFDFLSPFTLRMPKRPQRDQILELAQAFVAYEQSLPPEAQTPYTEIIANHLAELSADHNAISQGEVQRRNASKAVKKLDRKVGRLLNQMASMVRTALYSVAEDAYAWGFRANQTNSKLSIPRNRRKRLALLEAYIAKEESRPEAERFPMPPLSQVKEIRTQLATNLAVRENAQTQRESGVVARNEDSQTLLEYLQLAAAHIIGIQYGFKLSPELQRWGFEVVTRRGAGVPIEAPEAETVVAAEAAPQEETTSTEPTDQDTVASSNGVHYEAEQNGSYQAEPSMVNGSG